MRRIHFDVALQAIHAVTESLIERIYGLFSAVAAELSVLLSGDKAAALASKFYDQVDIGTCR